MKPISVEPGVYGPNVHVRHWGFDLSMLDRMCESCEEPDCRAVATVHWANPGEFGGETRYRSGRRCVATIGDLAEMYPEWHRVDVYVDLPTWTSRQLADRARIGYTTVNYWTSERRLIAETGPNPGRGRERLYLADMVEQATWMGTLHDLSRGGVSGDVTARLLHYSPDARDHLTWIREALEATAAGTRII